MGIKGHFYFFIIAHFFCFRSFTFFFRFPFRRLLCIIFFLWIQFNFYFNLKLFRIVRMNRHLFLFFIFF